MNGHCSCKSFSCGSGSFLSWGDCSSGHQASCVGLAIDLCVPLCIWSSNRLLLDLPALRILGSRGSLHLHETCAIGFDRRPKFGTAYSFAENKSKLLGVIFWWTPRQVAVCAFLDTRSRAALWICNSSLLVDSIEVQLSRSNLSIGLPSNFPTRVPTPPLESAEEVWN